ncbi:Multidrug resistance protein MdtE precursor [compost metagenome]
MFEEGAQVKKGQLLYVIEDASFRAAVVAAKKSLTEATAMIQTTRSRAEHYDALLAQKTISREDAVEARNAYLQARASVRARRRELDAAQVNLESTRIRAPITGIIGRTFVAVGERVESKKKEALALINRTDEVFVDINHSANRLLSLRESLKSGDLHPTSDDDTMQMRVVLSNGEEYNQIGNLRLSEAVANFTTPCVTLRALFRNPDSKILPGTTVRAIVTEGIRMHAILVPQRGITRDAEGNGIALILDQDNLVVRRPVVIDRAVGDQWLITAGLSENDRLIVDGLNLIAPGQVVRPFPPRPSIARHSHHG